jgi:flagellar protein FlbD
MIQVTRLDGAVMVVNVDQIAWIEEMPDTVISLMNGEKLLVREAPDLLIARAKEFKRSVAMPVVRLVDPRVELEQEQEQEEDDEEREEPHRSPRRGGAL